jgi:hypothetical protein
MIDVPELREDKYMNPKIAYRKSYQMIQDEIPFEHIRKNFDAYGELSESTTQNPVRHTRWEYLHFVNSSVFAPAAEAFKQSEIECKGTSLKPAFCPHMKGTTPYKHFWREEWRRCKEGYEPEIDGKPCGVRISGEHYFYLNFCRIVLVEKNEQTGEYIDVEQFPRFLSMDYYWFKELEARENPHLYKLPLSYKKSMICAKARRKGFSYKAAGGAVWKAVFNKNVKIAIVSETGEDATRCFEKCLDMIDFLSEYTEFGVPNMDPQTNGGWVAPIARNKTKDAGNIILGRKNTRTKQLAGRRSEIYTVSLRNQSDKAAGAGCARVLFEEAGKITDLKRAWTFTEPLLRSGDIYRGIGIIFGTGGDMGQEGVKKGSSQDFSELFYNPDAAGIAEFSNVHETTEQKGALAGWFVDDMWFRETAEPLVIEGKEYWPVDKQGNACRWAAEIALNRERTRKAKGKKDEYETFLTQYCKTPAEAFLQLKGNIFPVADLHARFSAINTSRIGFRGIRMPGELVEYNGVVSFKPDLEGKLQPIDTYKYDGADREGCLLQYEKPLKLNGVIPPGAYIISVDPIGQNTVGGRSLTSIIVMKTNKYHHHMGPAKIVMTYRGRNGVNPQGHVHQMLMKLSKYYNAQITYENDRDGGIFQYFLRKKAVNRLMSKPFKTVSKYMPNSKTLLREYGHSMATTRHKRIGEDLVLEWLLDELPSTVTRDNDGNEVKIGGVRNLDVLEDQALLEELIAYNRDGNFDVVMSLAGAILQLNEMGIDEELSGQEMQSVSEFWNEIYTNLYGSPQEKLKLARDKARKRKNNYNAN